MLYLGFKNWSFKPEGSKEELSGVSVFLAKDIDTEKGKGYEAMKKKVNKDFDTSVLSDIDVLDNVDVYFDEYGSVQHLAKA